MTPLNHDQDRNSPERSLGPQTHATVAPFFTALGITLTFLGLVSSYVVLAAGLAVFSAAALRWILALSLTSNDHAD